MFVDLNPITLRILKIYLSHPVFPYTNASFSTHLLISVKVLAVYHLFPLFEINSVVCLQETHQINYLFVSEEIQQTFRHHGNGLYFP